MQNSGHLRLCQQPQAAHALRSDQINCFLSHQLGLSFELGLRLRLTKNISLFLFLRLKLSEIVARQLQLLVDTASWAVNNNNNTESLLWWVVDDKVMMWPIQLKLS